MGPEAQGEAGDVAGCGKDVEAPRGAYTSPLVAGVKGQVPRDLELFSNIPGRGLTGPASRRRGGPTSSSSSASPASSEAATPGSPTPGASNVSGPAEGRPKRACIKPHHLVVGSPTNPRFNGTKR